MIRIGIIGLGFMGYTHFTASKKLKNARVAAIATRNEKKLSGDWTGIQGNFGPPGGHVDLSDVDCHRDYQAILKDPNIDLVDICLPTDLHEKIALEAIAAGKHVLLEKPISIELDAADRICAAAEAAGVHFMVAHVLPFFPEFQYAADAIRGQKFGKLRGAHFRRMICTPDWSEEISDFRRLGGWGIDLHIHDTHFVSYACGQPKRVFSRGLLQDGFVNHVHSQYLFDDPDISVSSVSGGIAASGFQFGHAFEIYLEEATLLFDAGTVGGEWVVSRPLTLITDDGAVSHPEFDPDAEWCEAFTKELQVAVDSIVRDEPADVLSGTLARHALRVCHAEARSIAEGEIVDVE